MKKLAAALCLGAAVFAASVVPAAEGERPRLTTRLGLEGGYLAGTTSYHISVPTESTFLESELVWPLDSALVGISGEVGREDRWSIGFSVRTNAASVSGDMEDSDWIDGVRFIFSTSDVSSDSFSALLIRLRGGRRVARYGWGGVDIEGGLLYEYFDLAASDLLQFSPVGIAKFAAVVPGPVVTYKTAFSIPHAGLAVTWLPEGAFSLTGRAHFGYAFVSDEDDHLLRFKLSRAETDGPALLAGLEGTFSLTQRLTLSAGLEYLALRTNGSQDQFFYGGANRGLAFTGISDEIDSVQVSFLARLTSLF